MGTVLATPAEGSYELVVVAPDPGASLHEWLGAERPLARHPREPPERLGRSLNLGILSSKFDHVLLLNRGVTVTAGYLPILLHALRREHG